MNKTATPSANRFRFRAWDTLRKTMFYGSEVYCILLQSDLEKLPQTNFGWRVPINNSIEAVKIEGGILMQSTGLTDKEGIEVFEGDITRTKQGAIGRVFWEPKEARFCWTDGGCEWGFDKADTDEIIGNIWENPDLLPTA